MPNKWIENLAKQIIANQSFNFDNFSNARHKIMIEKEDKFYEYDRISLYCYCTNLSYEECLQLSEKLEQLIKRIDSKEINKWRKLRKEYISILNYFLLNPKMLDCKIIKCESPDFIVYFENKKIGIEVTALTTEYEEIMHSISKKYGNATTATEMKEKASKNFKNVDDYDYYEINNHPLVGTKSLNLDDVRNEYLIKILKKYEKYKDRVTEFDELLILYDAINCSWLTEKSDVDLIFNMIPLDMFTKKFNLGILMEKYNEKELICYMMF